MNKIGRPVPPPRKLNLQLELKQRFLHESLLEEYEYDYFKHYETLLQETTPDAVMIDQQPEITWSMRPYLLDFLIESHQSFRLHTSTLFLAINIVDRYCSKRVVFKKHYQLVGATSLWLAAKYEDKKSRVPTLRELKLMCGNIYDEEMFIQMEGHILNTLDWSIGHPTLENFLYFKLIEMEEFIALKDLLPTNLQSINIDSTIEKQLFSILKFPFIFEIMKFIGEFTTFHKQFLEIQPLLLSESIALLTRLILINGIFDLNWKNYNAVLLSMTSNMNDEDDKQVKKCLQLLLEMFTSIGTENLSSSPSSKHSHSHSHSHSNFKISKSLIKKYSRVSSGSQLSISTLVLKFCKFLAVSTQQVTSQQEKVTKSKQNHYYSSPSSISTTPHSTSLPSPPSSSSSPSPNKYNNNNNNNNNNNTEKYPSTPNVSSYNPNHNPNSNVSVKIVQHQYMSPPITPFGVTTQKDISQPSSILPTNNHNHPQQYNNNYLGVGRNNNTSSISVASSQRSTSNSSIFSSKSNSSFMSNNTSIYEEEEEEQIHKRPNNYNDIQQQQQQQQQDYYNSNNNNSNNSGMGMIQNTIRNIQNVFGVTSSLTSISNTPSITNQKIKNINSIQYPQYPTSTSTSTITTMFSNQQTINNNNLNSNLNSNLHDNDNETDDDYDIDDELDDFELDNDDDEIMIDYQNQSQNQTINQNQQQNSNLYYNSNNNQMNVYFGNATNINDYRAVNVRN